MTDEHVWEEGYEGHARAQRKRMAALPLSVKLAWLEEAQQVVEHLQRARLKSKRGAEPQDRESDG